MAVPGQVPGAGCTGSGVGCSVVPADIHVEGPVAGEAWGVGVRARRGVDLLHRAPQGAPPSRPKPRPGPAHPGWAGPCSATVPPTRPRAPPTLRARIWAPPTKQIPMADASHAASPFLGSAPTPPLRIHSRPHPPGAAPPTWRSPTQDSAHFKPPLGFFQLTQVAPLSRTECRAFPSRPSPPRTGLPDPAHVHPRLQAPLVSPRPAPSPPLAAAAHPLPSHTCWGLRGLQCLLAFPAVPFPAPVQLPRRLPLRARLRRDRREDHPHPSDPRSQAGWFVWPQTP